MELKEILLKFHSNWQNVYNSKKTAKLNIDNYIISHIKIYLLLESRIEIFQKHIKDIKAHLAVDLSAKIKAEYIKDLKVAEGFPSHIKEYKSQLVQYKTAILAYLKDKKEVHVPHDLLAYVAFVKNSTKISQTAFDDELNHLPSWYANTILLRLNDIKIQVKEEFKDVVSIYFHTFKILLAFYKMQLDNIAATVILDKTNNKSAAIIDKIVALRDFYIKSINSLNVTVNNIEWINVKVEIKDPHMIFYEANKDKFEIIPKILVVYKKMNALLKAQTFGPAKKALLDQLRNIERVNNVNILKDFVGFKDNKVDKHDMGTFDDNNAAFSPFYDGTFNITMDALEGKDVSSYDMRYFNMQNYNKILTLYEKLSGTVRVVVVPVIEGETPQMSFTDTKVEVEGKSYGPFYGVCKDNKNLNNIIGVDTLSEYLTSAPDNNLYLFTYGYSGSRKTSNLFGQKGAGGGLMQHFYNKLGDKLKLVNVYLLYDKLDNSMMSNNTKSNYFKFSKEYKNINTKLPTDMKALNKFVHEDLNKLSGSDGYPEFIKETPNNLASSRGFLFFEFHVGTNKLCVVDMAGSEHPYDILIKTLPTYNFPVIGQTDNLLRTNDIFQKDFVFGKVKAELQSLIDSITNSLASMTTFLANNTINIDLFANLTDFIEYYAFDKETSSLTSLSYKSKSSFRDKLITRPHTFIDESDSYFRVQCREINYMIKAIFCKSVITILYIILSANNLLSKNTKMFWNNKVDKTLKDRLNASLLFVKQTKIETIKESMSNKDLVETYCYKCLEILMSKYGIKQHINFIDIDTNGQIIINTEVKDYFTFLSYYYAKQELSEDHIDVDEEIYKIVFGSGTKNINKLKQLSILKYIKSYTSNIYNIENRLAKETIKKPYVIKTIERSRDPATPLIISGFSKDFDQYFKDKKIFAQHKDKIIVHETNYFEDIVREGFFINQVNNELINDILKANQNNSKSGLNKDVKTCAIEYDNVSINKYNFMSKLNCKTKLSELMTKITPKFDNNLYVMLCAIRTEPEVNYRLGAKQSLDLVNTLKST